MASTSATLARPPRPSQHGAVRWATARRKSSNTRWCAEASATTGEFAAAVGAAVARGRSASGTSRKSHIGLVLGTEVEDRLEGTAATVSRVEASIDAAAIRQKPEAPFQEAKQAVDLGQAERIVAVGRGIKSQDNLPIVQKLAAAMGAEVAASRPICDNGWLPMERQVGSSGQTVAPKLYMALGISGAIQHLVGMKGSRTIVAINKDADAPIFEVADYGIQGDLFELAPAIIAELQK